MKKGYIVWNMTNCGDGFEFFGVYQSWESAFKQFRKVIKARLGKCPRGDYEQISEWVEDNDPYAEDNSYRITPFQEDDGEAF